MCARTVCWPLLSGVGLGYEPKIPILGADMVIFDLEIHMANRERCANDR